MTLLSPSELLRVLPTVKPQMVRLREGSPRTFLWLGEVNVPKSVEHLVETCGEEPSTVAVLEMFLDRCDHFQLDLTKVVLPMISFCWEALVANLEIYPEVWSELSEERRLMVENVVAPLVLEEKRREERDLKSVSALLEELDRRAAERDIGAAGSNDHATEIPDP